MSEVDMPEEELSVALFFTEGKSDKEYRMQLKRDGDGFRVYAWNGKRGSSLVMREKTKGVVPYAAARKEYDKVLKSKIKGGYTTDVSGETFTTPENEDRKTEFRPQLLSVISAEEARKLSDDWLVGEKYDGRRRGIVIGKEGIRFANRDGLEVSVNQKIADDIARLALDLGEGEEAILDGEDMGDYVVIFDIIKYPQMKEGATVEERVDFLENLRDYSAGRNMKALRVEVPLPASEFFAERHDEIYKKGGEGYVMRHVSSIYEPGRGDQALKFKFLDTCTARVKGANGNKRSVSFEMKDADGKWTDMGNVTIPSNAQVPEKGDFIEIEYMNANRGGSLYQPVFKCLRDDVGEDACNMDTIVYKGEEREVPETGFTM